MAYIESGVGSAEKLTVDPTSKAARVTLYDSAGNKLLLDTPTGAYMLPVNIRQSAATAANATVWAMRNGATKVMSIRRLRLAMMFDGTAAATTTLKYTIQRFSAATPTAGTALTVIKKRSSYGASTVADARFLDTGLTTTSVTFETDAHILALPISVTSGNAFYDIQFGRANEPYGDFELAVNEGLCIRLLNTAVVGQGLVGGVEWDER